MIFQWRFRAVEEQCYVYRFPELCRVVDTSGKHRASTDEHGPVPREAALDHVIELSLVRTVARGSGTRTVARSQRESRDRFRESRRELPVRFRRKCVRSAWTRIPFATTRQCVYRECPSVLCVVFTKQDGHDGCGTECRLGRVLIRRLHGFYPRNFRRRLPRELPAGEYETQNCTIIRRRR